MEIHANDEGFVKSITCIEMELGEPDASGRRRPIEKKGSEFELDVDTVIMSLGKKELSPKKQDFFSGDNGYRQSRPD